MSCCLSVTCVCWSSDVNCLTRRIVTPPPHRCHAPPPCYHGNPSLPALHHVFLFSYWSLLEFFLFLFTVRVETFIIKEQLKQNLCLRLFLLQPLVTQHSNRQNLMLELVPVVSLPPPGVYMMSCEHHRYSGLTSDPIV